MARQLLLVVSHLGVGGTTKIVLGMLDALDPTEWEVTVASLQGGMFSDRIDESAHLIRLDRRLASLQLTRASLAQDVAGLLRAGQVGAVTGIVAGMVRRRPMSLVRQRARHDARGLIERHPVRGSFDVAIAMSTGLEADIVAHGVQASTKKVWLVSDPDAIPTDPRILGELLQCFHRGLSVSQWCLDRLRDSLPAMELPFGIAHPVISWQYYRDVHQPSTPMDELIHPRLLTVCRLQKGKGLDLILATATELASRGSDFSWSIVGDGPERHQFTEAIVAHGLSGQLHVLGAMPNVTDLLAQADILVHPSLSEGRATVVDEALGLGVWPVVTRYPTASEHLRDGEIGTLVEHDVAALADAIMANQDKTQHRDIDESLLAHARRQVQDIVAAD